MLGYRGISLRRNSAPLGPYSGNMPRALWWSWGGGAVSYERGIPVHPESLFLTLNRAPSTLNPHRPLNTIIEVGTSNSCRSAAPVNKLHFGRNLQKLSLHTFYNTIIQLGAPVNGSIYQAHCGKAIMSIFGVESHYIFFFFYFFFITLEPRVEPQHNL